MKKQLTFEHFNLVLSRSFINYYSLLYANVSMGAHLKHADTIECRFDKAFGVIGNDTDLINKKKLVLREDVVMNYIYLYGEVANLNIETSINQIIGYNAHFLRTKIINSHYELMVNYINGRDKDELNQYFHTYDWFQVLHVLRNFTSHGDGLNYSNKFPALGNKKKIPPYPNTIKWGGFEIYNGQADEILYTDKDLIELLLHITDFFQKNLQFRQ